MAFITKKFITLALTGTVCLVPNLPALAAENLIRNSSFEVGMDGYGILRAEYLKHDQKEIPYFAPVLDTKDKVDGDTSLRIDNPNAGSYRFFTKAFNVDPNKKYVFSFMAKAGVPGQNLTVYFETAEGFYGDVEPHFVLTNEWKRYSTPPMTVPNGKKICGIQLMYGVLERLKVGTSLWFDALDLSEAPESKYVPRPLEIGIINGLPRPYTLSMQQNVPVSFKVRNNAATPMGATLRYQVVDEYFKKVVMKGEIGNLKLGAASMLMPKLPNVSPKKHGKFVLKADLAGGDGKVVDHSELDFAVIDSVKKGPGQFTDDFSVSGHGGQRGCRPMGSDGQHDELWILFDKSVDDMFDFRAEAGDRWIRDWDNSCVFNWSNIEPKDGQFEWTVVDRFVNENKKRGIRVLPVLGGVFIMENLDTRVPKWLVDAHPESVVPRTVDPKQQVFLPPLDKWNRYVREAVKRYKGTITTYEIFNEPNLWISADEYVRYLKSAYAVIKEVDPKAKVVAFSSSQDHGGQAIKYLEECFALGALKYCDIVSFHPYGASNDWAVPQSAEQMNHEVRALMNRNGAAAMPLWCGELYNVNRPDVPDGNWDYKGRTIRGNEAARRYLIDLSTGLNRSFTLPFQNYVELFRPDSWATNVHLTGAVVPSTTFVVYNTIARLFEGAKPRGEVTLEGKNKLYLYSKGTSPLAASWSFDWDDKPSQLVIKGGAGKFQLLDLMGNSSDQGKVQGKDLIVTISNSLIYFFPTKGAEAQFRPLLQNAKIAP